MRYPFIQGLDDEDRMEEAEAKQRQEADTMHRRVQMRGQPAVDAYQSAPMVGDEDSPEQHQALMQQGRELAGDFDGITQIGLSAMSLEDRLANPRPRSPVPSRERDGIDSIGDAAMSMMARAQAPRAPNAALDEDAEAEQRMRAAMPRAIGGAGGAPPASPMSYAPTGGGGGSAYERSQRIRNGGRR